MQGLWVWSMVQEDLTCFRATKPLCHNYWSPGALEPLQQEKQPQWEAHPFLHLDSSSHSPKLEKSPSTNEDPAQSPPPKKRLLIPNAGGQDSIPSQGTGSYMFQLRKISFMSQLRPGAAKKRKQARKRKNERALFSHQVSADAGQRTRKPSPPAACLANSSSAARWRCFVIVEKSPSSKVLSGYQRLSSQNFSKFNYIFVGCPH